MSEQVRIVTPEEAQAGLFNAAQFVTDLEFMLLYTVAAERGRTAAAVAVELDNMREWVMSGHPAWPGCAPWYREREKAEQMLRDHPHPDAYIAWRYRTDWQRAEQEQP